MKKPAVFITAIITITILITGCSLIGFAPARKEKAKRLLEEKYGEEFVIDDYKGQGSYLQDYYTVTAHSREYPTVVFSAGIGTGDDSISDTYVCKRVMDRTSKDLIRSMGDLTGERYVFMQAWDYYPLLSNPDATLDEMFEASPSNQELTVYVNYIPAQGDSAEDIYDAAMMMASVIPTAKGRMAFYICDAKTLEKVQQYVESHDVLYDSYDSIVENRYIGRLDYQEGKVTSSKAEFVETVREMLKKETILSADMREDEDAFLWWPFWTMMMQTRKTGI